MTAADVFAAATIGFSLAAMLAAWCGHKAHALRLLVAASLCCVAVVARTIPARTLYAIGFYAGATVLLLALAAVALWPVLEDVFVQPRRIRLWQRESRQR